MGADVVDPCKESAVTTPTTLEEEVRRLCEKYGVDDATIIVGDGGEPEWREVDVPMENFHEVLKLSRWVVGAFINKKVRPTVTLRDGDGVLRLALGFKVGYLVAFVRSASGSLANMFPGGKAFFVNEILGRRPIPPERAETLKHLRRLLGVTEDGAGRRNKYHRRRGQQGSTAPSVDSRDNNQVEVRSE